MSLCRSRRNLIDSKPQPAPHSAVRPLSRKSPAQSRNLNQRIETQTSDPEILALEIAPHHRSNRAPDRTRNALPWLKRSWPHRPRTRTLFWHRQRSAVAQFVALDLAGFGARELVHELDLARRFERRDAGDAKRAQLIGFVRRGFGRLGEHHERLNDLRFLHVVAFA